MNFGPASPVAPYAHDDAKYQDIQKRDVDLVADDNYATLLEEIRKEGAKVIDQLAADLKEEGAKGFRLAISNTCALSRKPGLRLKPAPSAPASRSAMRGTLSRH